MDHSASTSARFSPTLVQVAHQQVASFATSTPGVMRVVLTTADGFEITSFHTEKATSAKLAAISSSLQALAEALAREAQLNDVQDVIVQTGNGVMLVKGIGGTKPALTLAVFAGNTAVLGHLLWAAKTCCHAIARAAHA